MNLLQILIIPWIAHKFVKAIQGGCVQTSNREDMKFNSQIWRHICFDGWNDLAQCPLLNIIFACSSGDVFIGYIDTIGEWKHAHYVCNALGGYIEIVGINNIVQICTDNASNMRSATHLRIYHFPSIYF